MRTHADYRPLPLWRDAVAAIAVCCLAMLSQPLWAAPAGHEHPPGSSEAQAERGGPRVTAFISVDATAADANEDPPRLHDDVRATADLLLTWQRGGFRSLAELVVATDETELERLQLGWEMAPNTLLWIGRFHQPASYFGYLYHHGQIAQTAISKPQVDDWEDEGGLVPQHLQGVLLDTSWTTVRGQRFDLSVGAGIAPALTDGELEPRHLFEGSDHASRPAYALRATWYPDALRDPSLSVVFMHAEIGNETGGAVLPASVSHLDQDAVGVFADYPVGRWRVTGGGYRIRVRADASAAIPAESFWSGYLQVDYEWRPAWRWFGRVEGTQHADQSRFLRVFDSVVRSRSMVGLRWDLSPRQALTVEAARTSTVAVAGNEVRVQWSAVAR